MFEIPEFITLARQVNETLTGKIVARGSLGNSPHKFVWYNRSPEEFAALTQGKQVGRAYARAKWLFIPLEPSYLLTFGECGGRVLYHPAGALADGALADGKCAIPAKYHLYITFEDGSALTATTQMWGAMELFETGKEIERQYIQGMRTTPVEPGFTFDYFSALIDEQVQLEKRSVKGLLTQEGLVPGLGNAITQDILFRAKLHPKHPIGELSPEQRRRLFDAIHTTLDEAIRLGGRNDEVDLYNRPGGYLRLMDSRATGKPCPACGTPVEKIQYLGGACYFCSHCQE